MEQLTDLVFLDLPDIGKTVNTEEPFGEIESVKAVSDLVSPLSGKITEVNTTLANNLDPLLKDAYGEGWIIKLQIENPQEAEKLLSSQNYAEHIGQQ